MSYVRPAKKGLWEGTIHFRSIKEFPYIGTEENYEVAHARENESFIEETWGSQRVKRRFCTVFLSKRARICQRDRRAQKLFTELCLCPDAGNLERIVDAFVESYFGLKQHAPNLYGTLCDILNQDPLTADKILPK